MKFLDADVERHLASVGAIVDERKRVLYVLTESKGGFVSELEAHPSTEPSKFGRRASPQREGLTERPARQWSAPESGLP